MATETKPQAMKADYFFTRDFLDNNRYVVIPVIMMKNVPLT